METLSKEQMEWARTGPRASLSTIAEKLGIEKEPQIKQAIVDNTKTKLLENGTAMAAAERAWKGDLFPAISNLVDTTKTLEQLAKNGGDKAATYEALLEKEAGRTAEIIDSAMVLYRSKKASLAREVVENIKSLGRPTKAEGPTMTGQVKQDLENSISGLASLQSNALKNVDRIRKSVPPAYWQASTHRPRLEKLIKEFTAEVTDLGGAMQKAVDAISAL